MKSMLIKYDQEMTPDAGRKGYFPSLEISGKTIPKLLDMKLGDECELRIKVKIKTQREDDRGAFTNVDVVEGEYVE